VSLPIQVLQVDRADSLAIAARYVASSHSRKVYH
jgi:hypothetical protein